MALVRTFIYTFNDTFFLCVSSWDIRPFYLISVYPCPSLSFEEHNTLPLKYRHVPRNLCWNPTLHNLFYSTSFRLGRSKCRSRPGTGCTLHTWGRLHATPGRGRLSGCIGRVSDFHSPHTLRFPTSLCERGGYINVTVCGLLIPMTSVLNPLHLFSLRRENIVVAHVSQQASIISSILQSHNNGATRAKNITK